jgi:hypothetical protein
MEGDLPLGVESSGCAWAIEGGIVTDDRSGESQQSTVTSPPSSEERRPEPPQEVQPIRPAGDEEKEEEQEKSPPYNLWFAWTVLAVAIVAYVLTMWLFLDLFEDPAVVTGALGALFTLIGTVAGAYFGIKSSSDTADRAKVQVDAANARTERANKSARAALLEVDPNKSEEFRARGLV